MLRIMPTSSSLETSQLQLGLGTGIGTGKGAILQKWVPYSQWYLFNAIPDTHHNPNPIWGLILDNATLLTRVVSLEISGNFPRKISGNFPRKISGNLF